MATTKALELGQFGTDLTVDDSTGAVTIANDLTMNAATSTGIDDNADQTVITIDSNELVTLAGALDVNGTEILVGTADSRFAENNLRFNATGSSYIDVATTGQSLNFRVSNASALDTTALILSSDGNATFAGELRGPSLFIIDPSTYDTDSDAGSAAGTVRIRGDLIVDGDTTTINSTTLTVDDLNIVLASGAADAASADGAGITIDGASATLLYQSSGNKFAFNRSIDVAGKVTSTDIDILSNNPRIRLDDSDTDNNAEVTLDNTSLRIEVDEDDAIADSLIKFRVDADTKAVITSTGRLGIGTEDPNATLVVSTNGAQGIEFFPTAASGVATTQYYNRSGAAYVRNRNIALDHTFNVSGATDDAVTIATTGNVGIKNDAPTVALEVGKLVNGETQLAIFNSEGGNQAGVHVKSRTNRATLQVSDNDTTAFVQAEDDHAIYGQHSSLASADMTIDTAGNMNLQNGSYYVDQVRHDKRPVFNFDFANSKELDSRFTFVRGSRGSYVDEGGFVKYANQNVPRFDHNPATGESLGLLIEENRSNEIIDPVNMYSSWVETSAAINRNYALAPDGTWSAIRIQPDGLNQSSFAQQTRTVAYSTTYSISSYVKSDGADYAFLAFANTGFNGRATIIVNLSNGDVEFSNGTSASSITSFVEEQKNGWWRIGLTVTSDGDGNGAAGSFEIGPSDEATPADGTNANPRAGNDNKKALLVWGPQREVGTNISSYIPPTISFSSRSSYGSYFDEEGIIQYAPPNEERYTHGYDGTKVIKGGFIAEEERSNLHPGSEWNNTSNPTIVGSIVASGRSKTDFQTENTTAPDGSLWPIIITNAVAGGNYYYYNYSSLTLGVNYTFSVFFRLPTNNTENINSFTVYAHNNSFPNYYYATYDFTTDAITQNSSNTFWTIQKYPNNWRRISITAAPDANSSFDFLFHFNASGSTTAQSYGGGGTAGLPIGYIFGAQLEQSNSPSTYISTGRSNTYGQVTRGADAADYYDGYRLDDLCDIYNTDEINSDRGTVYTEWSSKVPSSDGVGGVFEMWDSNAGGANGIDQRLNSFYVTNNYGVSTGNYLGANVVAKTSLGYDKDNVLDWRTTANGVHTGTNSVHKFSMNLTRLSLGRIDLSPAYMLNGHLKRFVLYNSQLQLDEQKALTENN